MTNAPHRTDPARERHRQERIAHWDGVARQSDTWKGWGGYYHDRLAEVYRFLVPPGLRVLEIGCGQGGLLAALGPSRGVGVDFSGEMLARAARNHPGIRLVQADAHDLALDEQFDAIILSDLLNDLWDVQTALSRVVPLSHPHTRIVINFYSRLWQLPLSLARRAGLATSNLYQNWLTVEDIANLLGLVDLEVIRHWTDMLLPLQVSFLSKVCNRYLVKVSPFRHLALTNFIVARPRPSGAGRGERPLVSVIVPARNEAGNIPAIFERTPEMGRGTEIIFVEGNSRDDTYGAIERAIAAYPERRARLFRQRGAGKGDAVRLGFDNAAGDVLMILDADMTVPPEDLSRFCEAIESGKGEFVNGVRLVYPMEKEAMRFFNLVGNKFFSLAFSWLLGQPVKDTLCGTKVLWKDHYAMIAANRSYFGDFDPFGDFDLLFGAAKFNLKIVEMPVRYRERTYGETNISRWQHGWLLLKMVFFALRRIKFV